LDSAASELLDALGADARVHAAKEAGSPCVIHQEAFAPTIPQRPPVMMGAPVLERIPPPLPRPVPTMGVPRPIKPPPPPPKKGLVERLRGLFS
jgi:hypothetical protein